MRQMQTGNRAGQDTEDEEGKRRRGKDRQNERKQVAGPALGAHLGVRNNITPRKHTVK